MIQSLNKYDVKKCVVRIPKKIRELMKQEKNMYIAGGFIRSVIVGDFVNDIDIFAGDRETSRKLVHKLTNRISDIKETDNAFTLTYFRPPTQFIHRWVFDNYEDLIESFDYTICKAVIRYNSIDKTWEGFCSEKYYPDLAARRLVYCNPIRDEEAGGSMLRLLKYYRKGYTSPLSTIADVIARLALSNYNLSEEIDVVDFSYFIKGQLIEVDPNTAAVEML